MGCGSEGEPAHRPLAASASGSPPLPHSASDRVRTPSAFRIPTGSAPLPHSASDRFRQSLPAAQQLPERARRQNQKRSLIRDIQQIGVAAHEDIGPPGHRRGQDPAVRAIAHR